MNFSYKKLVVWQKAMQLVRRVYVLSKTFPADERFALTDQLRRAVVSVPSNIAEGDGRASNKDYAHFLAIARGSLYETMTQIQVACDLGYCVAQPEIESLADEIVRTSFPTHKQDLTNRCSPSPSTFASSSSFPTHKQDLTNRCSPSPSTFA